MPIFRLDVEWKMVGTMEVEADTLDDAVEKAVYDEPLPEGEYLCDSFRVVKDLETGVEIADESEDDDA